MALNCLPDFNYKWAAKGELEGKIMLGESLMLRIKFVGILHGVRVGRARWMFNFSFCGMSEQGFVNVFSSWATGFHRHAGKSIWT